MKHINNPISRAKLGPKINWVYTIQNKSILILINLKIRVPLNNVNNYLLGKQKESNMCPKVIYDAYETLRHYVAIAAYKYTTKSFSYLFMILTNLVIYFLVRYKPKSWN